VDRTGYEELVRLERATAELQGRDPDQAEAIVAARFTSSAQRVERDRRVTQTREELRVRRRAARLRVLKIGVVVVLLGGAAVPVTRMVMQGAERATAARAQLTGASSSAVTLGFTTKEDWLDLASGGAELSIAGATCSAVVAVRDGSTEPVKLRVDRGPLGQIEGRGGRIWCSCEPEKAVVVVVEPGDARHALRWLAVPAAVVGGLDLLGDHPPDGFTVYAGEHDRSCTDTAFAEWSAVAGHGDLDATPEAKEGPLAFLGGLGLEPLGQLSQGRRLAVIRLDEARCYLVVPVGERSEVTLRGQSGVRLAERKRNPIGWCNYRSAALASLWREPSATGHHVVLRVSAARVGGLMGLRETAEHAGLEGTELVVDGALAVDEAVAMLVASGVTESTIVKGTERGLPDTPERKLVAVVSRPGGAAEPAGTPAVPMACWPPIDQAGSLSPRACVQAKAQPWRVTGLTDGVVTAAADLPFWLLVLSETAEPDALAATAGVLAIARHLTLRGFEPTTTAGVQYTFYGARVGGVVGKKEFVAFAVSKSKPWIHPLGVGRPWTFTELPPITPLAPAASVEVRAAGSLGTDPGSRRVVVWRR